MTWKDVLLYLEEYRQDTSLQVPSLVNSYSKTADFFNMAPSWLFLVSWNKKFVYPAAWTKNTSVILEKLTLEVPFKLQLESSGLQEFTKDLAPILWENLQNSELPITQGFVLPLLTASGELIAFILMTAAEPEWFSEQSFLLPWEHWKTALLQNLFHPLHPEQDLEKLKQHLVQGNKIIKLELDLTQALDAVEDKKESSDAWGRKLEQDFQDMAGDLGCAFRPKVNRLEAYFSLSHNLDQSLFLHQLATGFSWPEGVPLSWEIKIITTPGEFN